MIPENSFTYIIYRIYKRFVVNIITAIKNSSKFIRFLYVKAAEIIYIPNKQPKGRIQKKSYFFFKKKGMKRMELKKQ